MILPTIHLNGNGAKAIIDELQETCRKIETAYEAVAHMDLFNARNYYPQGPEACDMALDDKKRFLTKLKSVHDELHSALESLVEDNINDLYPDTAAAAGKESL